MKRLDRWCRTAVICLGLALCGCQERGSGTGGPAPKDTGKASAAAEQAPANGASNSGVSR